MDEVRVSSPASVSNVVCGFDCLGFALERPADEILVRKIPKRTVRISHHDDFALPLEPERNVVGVALLAMMRAADLNFGFEVEVTKGIRPGSGIGSSAASSSGAVVAANWLLNEPFSELDLARFAMEGEKVASGALHADNVAPCIFGGFTLVRSTEALDIVRLVHPPLYAAVIHPQIEIKTSESRALLPAQIDLKDAVRYWSNLGAFVSALGRKDYALLGRSMEDVIIEPARKSLIPKFDELKSASLSAGAIGGGISGSGPSVFMLCLDQRSADDVASAMRHVYLKIGVEFNLFTSVVGSEGVRVL